MKYVYCTSIVSVFIQMQIEKKIKINHGGFYVQLYI